MEGVLVAILSSIPQVQSFLEKITMEHGLTNVLGGEGFKWLAVAFFAGMGYVLYKVATQKNKSL